MPAADPALPPAAEAVPDEAALRAALVRAARGYFEARRARVDDFTARRFRLRGTLTLHRAAFGWDILRAPVNLALAPVYALSRLGASAADGLGAKRPAAWLRGRRIMLRTDVARAVERAVIGDLLELPLRGESAPRDALAEAILAEPAVRALLGQARAGAQAARGGASLEEYLGARAAVAEMTTALGTMSAGAAVFGKVTPGMLSLGPSVAAALAHNAAVAAFPLGATAGSVWYGVFPAAASTGLVAGATLGLAAGGALAAAFAGVVADPVQARLGVHQRRLRRLIDAMEREFLAEEGPGFAAREHYLARLMDVADAASAAFRLARGG